MCDACNVKIVLHLAVKYGDDASVMWNKEVYRMTTLHTKSNSLTIPRLFQWLATFHRYCLSTVVSSFT